MVVEGVSLIAQLTKQFESSGQVPTLVEKTSSGKPSPTRLIHRGQPGLIGDRLSNESRHNWQSSKFPAASSTRARPSIGPSLENGPRKTFVACIIDVRALSKSPRSIAMCARLDVARCSAIARPAVRPILFASVRKGTAAARLPSRIARHPRFNNRLAVTQLLGDSSRTACAISQWRFAWRLRPRWPSRAERQTCIYAVIVGFAALATIVLTSAIIAGASDGEPP